MVTVSVQGHVRFPEVTCISVALTHQTPNPLKVLESLTRARNVKHTKQISIANQQAKPPSPTCTSKHVWWATAPISFCCCTKPFACLLCKPEFYSPKPQ